jgi:hypothetical protein
VLCAILHLPKKTRKNWRLEQGKLKISFRFHKQYMTEMNFINKLRQKQQSCTQKTGTTRCSQEGGERLRFRLSTTSFQKREANFSAFTSHENEEIPMFSSLFTFTAIIHVEK